MKNSKEIYKALPENEKLALIEKVMPHSGSYIQLENEADFSDGQIEEMARIFVNSIDWEQGLEMEEIDIHDKSYVIKGKSELGNTYDAIGYYSCGSLVFIADLEFKLNENNLDIAKFHIEESNVNKGCFILVATTIKGQKFVVGGNPYFPNFLDKYETCFEITGK